MFEPIVASVGGDYDHDDLRALPPAGITRAELAERTLLCQNTTDPYSPSFTHD